MRRVAIATALALALMLPSAAAAEDAPMPPALMCVKYRATIVCFLWQSPTTLWWSTPWHSGATTAYLP